MIFSTPVIGRDAIVGDGYQATWVVVECAVLSSEDEGGETERQQLRGGVPVLRVRGRRQSGGQGSSVARRGDAAVTSGVAESCRDGASETKACEEGATRSRSPRGASRGVPGLAESVESGGRTRGCAASVVGESQLASAVLPSAAPCAPSRDALVSVGGVALEALARVAFDVSSPWFCMASVLERAQEVLLDASRKRLSVDFECQSFLTAVATAYGCSVQALLPCFLDVRHHFRVQRCLLRRDLGDEECAAGRRGVAEAEDARALRRAVCAVVAAPEGVFRLTVAVARERLADAPGACDLLMAEVGDSLDELVRQETMPELEQRGRDWLLEAGMDPARCRACVWSADKQSCVFRQCQRAVLPDGSFCRVHRGYCMSGYLDAERGLVQVPPRVYARGLLEARRRAGLTLQGSMPVARGGSAAEVQRRRETFRSCRQRAPFVAVVPGELRRFAQDPLALPPVPCRLCVQSFATRASLHAHIEAEHVSLSEYRKRLFYLVSSFEAVQVVPPQVWRHVTEAFSEHLVSGTDAWPACAVEEDDHDAGSIDEKREGVRGEGREGSMKYWWRTFRKGQGIVGPADVGGGRERCGAGRRTGCRGSWRAGFRDLGASA